MRYFIFSLIALSSFMACQQNCQEQKTIPPAGSAGSSTAPQRNVVEGKVLEAIHQKGFSYLRLALATGKEEWVALLDDQSKVGDVIKVEEQVTIPDFNSKSLDRTFKKMMFGTLVKKSQ